MNSFPPDTQAWHPVRLVSARTGLSPHVLRVWERRYGVVQPRRTAGGQRLYSDADIERLELLKRAADAGRNIGQLAKQSNDALRALVASDGQRRPPESERTVEPGRGEAISDDALVKRCLDAVLALEPVVLETELRRATILLPLAQFADDVLVPLLYGIGVLWTEGDLGPAQEHAASAVVRRVLDDIIRSCDPASDALPIIVATPAGQRHELGALLAAVSASSMGWRVIYLGMDLPASEIARAAELAPAKVIALSIVHPAPDERLRADLEVLAAALPAGHALILGGAAAPIYARKLQRPNVHAISSLAAFREMLLQIEAESRA